MCLYSLSTKSYVLFSVNWMFLLAVAIAKFAVFFLVLLIGRTLISIFKWIDQTLKSQVANLSCGEPLRRVL